MRPTEAGSCVCSGVSRYRFIVPVHSPQTVRQGSTLWSKAARHIRAGCISKASCTIPGDSAVAMHASRPGKACRMQFCIVHPKCRQRSSQRAMSDGIQRPMSGNVRDTMPEHRATALRGRCPGLESLECVAEMRPASLGDHCARGVDGTLRGATMV